MWYSVSIFVVGARKGIAGFNFFSGEVKFPE